MTDIEILNYIPVPIYGIDYYPELEEQRGEIVFLNKNTAELVGYSEQEITHMGLDIFKAVVHPDDLFKISLTVNILLQTTLNEYIEFYRVKSRNSVQYKFMKVYSNVIRPASLKKLTQIIVTVLKASVDEIQEHFPEIEETLERTP